MHLAQTTFRALTSFAAAATLTFMLAGPAGANRLPLLGPGAAPSTGPTSVIPASGYIVAVDPDSVPCIQIASFGNVDGGETPGISYDGLIFSGGLSFAERFVGQTVGYGGDFDVISGLPINPLILQVGAPGQNLDVFAYTTNVLAGLGHLGYPDLDAIGEGSISIYFPFAQSRVSFDLVGGNGGSATLGFYRADGTLIDNVTVTGLGDGSYGFATANGIASISGLLIQNTDPAGIGVVNICHDGGITNSRPTSWGGLKKIYR